MQETAILERLKDTSLTKDEQARLRCQLAKSLEEAGKYEAARGAMGDLWGRIGQRPSLAGLDTMTASEVLLRAGCLTGWIGRERQIEGAQDAAKDLIHESLRRFEEVGETVKVAEARTDLAYCDWRTGAFDESRIGMRMALEMLAGEGVAEQRAVTLIRSAIVELSAKCYDAALQFLREAAPVVACSSSHALKGKFHMNLGIVLKELSVIEGNEEYRDQALIETEAASFHLEKAGHTVYRANNENNLGFLMLTAGRFVEAHEHLNCARRLFIPLKFRASIAQVDETQARVFLAQKRNAEAEKLARSAVAVHEQGDELALLTEALVTHGKALARLRRNEESRAALARAAAVAERAGDGEGAADACLTAIEESGHLMADDEILSLWERADLHLADTKHQATLQRLRAASRRLLLNRRVAALEMETGAFVHSSAESAELLRRAQRVAGADCTVLLTGETGTGKEVLAKLIHTWSGRTGAFVPVNCAAIPDTLMESELFGHRKGAFTDAQRDYEGAVKHAAGGTLFLDEVGELTPSSQAKILRLIENKEIHPVGAGAPEEVNVRIVAATNRDLERLAAAGRFRQDLLYRLRVFNLDLRPLRERPEDIEALSLHFIHDATRRYNKRVSFTPGAINGLRQLPLKGNARELRAVVESAVLMSAEGATIREDDVKSFAIRSRDNLGLTVAEPWARCSLDVEVLRYERDLIRLALERAGNVTQAARLLGVSHQRLSSILSGRQRKLREQLAPRKERKVSIIPPKNTANLLKRRKA